MKKVLIIAAILVVGFVILITPFMGDSRPEGLPATFAFDGNLQFQENTDIELAIDVVDTDISKLSVLFNGKEVKSWTDIKQKMSFKLVGNSNGVGAKQLELRSEYEDGTRFTDTRMIRVLSDITPEQLTVKVNNEYPHNPSHFTQGLEFYNGELFEGTGQYGQSQISAVEITTGKESTSKIIKLDGTHFGEGITFLNDRLYQLTWRKGKCLTYLVDDSIIPDKDFAYTGEGWGLTNDGKQLIMSNGTERLVFRDPNTFLIDRTIEVYNQYGPVGSLNELEWINGKIYANVWMSDKIYVIDPASGKVLQEINASSIKERGQGPDQEVLNGIAFNPETGKIYLTGKNWVKMFEVEFVKAN